jgi:hypothetical protein
MAVSKRLRFEVLRRDNHTCRYCGRTAPEVKLTIDHVVPEALGGRTEPANLAAACGDCNSGKSSIAPDSAIVDDVALDALRWRRAMVIAASLQTDDREKRDADRSAFERAWKDWTYRQGIQTLTLPLDPDWPETVDRFRSAGLAIGDLLDAVDKAMRKQKIDREAVFKYFCGICWRMLEDRREIAAQLLEAATDAELEHITNVIEGTA